MKFLILLIFLSGCSWFQKDYNCETNTDFEKAYNQYDQCRREEKVHFSQSCMDDAFETHCSKK